MNIFVIALDELAKLMATRRGWLSLSAFALIWGCLLVYAIVPAAGWLFEPRVPGSGGLIDPPALAPLLERFGLASLVGWPSPQLGVYWVVALTLLPPFAVLVSADQTASDLGRGTLRFHALRASRSTLFLGRFLGQCLIQLGLVLITLLSVLTVVAVQLPEQFPVSLGSAPVVVLNLMVSLLPWIALMALCSALARSPRQATLFAVVAWIVVWLAIALVRDALGPLAFLEHLMPGSEVSALRGLSGLATLEHAYVPLLQTMVLLALGLQVFARRDL